MIIETKEITGWKFETAEDVATAEAFCQSYFNLPKRDGDITTVCLDAVPNYDANENIEFYYVGYTYPSQLIEVAYLGSPTTFDVNIIFD